MATKKICDACGNDMTDDPQRLAFEVIRDRLAAKQYSDRVWPGGDMRVSVGAVYLETDTGPRARADVCADCIIRAVTEGRPIDLGPVTR